MVDLCDDGSAYKDIKFSTAKPADLSSIPGIHIVEKRMESGNCPLTSTCTPYPHDTQSK